MDALLIGVAVCAVLIVAILVYSATLKDIYKEKLATDEAYLLFTRDLWQIRVCRYRKGRTNGQPVLLVHGASVNQHNFTSPRGGSLVDHLVERGFDCWTVDLRGCRSSIPPFERHRNQVTIDDYLNDDIPSVIRFIQQETGFAKIHYCGHSMGGMLLYAYVLKFGSDDIASGVTLGSPLGFDDVNLRRSRFLVSLLSLHPGLWGGCARAMIPLARVLGLNSLLFPMNTRNLAKGMDSSYFYTMLEDPLPGVLKQLGHWVNTPGWKMDGGRLDMLAGLKQLDIPLFALFAPLDPFVSLDKARTFFAELPSQDKRMLVCSKEQGCKHDYNHCDLAFGAEGHREVFGPIGRWFETHSTHERIPVNKADIAAGYQTPLNVDERAEILSGESFAHLAGPEAPVEEDAAAAIDVPPESPPSTPRGKPAAKKTSPRRKSPSRGKTGKNRNASGVMKDAREPGTPPNGPDLASVSAALNALRPHAMPASQATDIDPIKVKSTARQVPARKDEPVETPASVLKALSNASGAMDAFKRTGENPKQ